MHQDCLSKQASTNCFCWYILHTVWVHSMCTRAEEWLTFCSAVKGREKWVH